MPSTSFQADWNEIKTAFVKHAREVPPEVSMLVSQGRDFGPALKAFDGANSFEKKMKAMPAVLKARNEYDSELNAALKNTDSKVGRKGIEMFLKQIDLLAKRGEDAAQPPRPSGKMVEGFALRQFDLAAGVKTTYLKVDPIQVTAQIEVDSEFKRLVDAGEAGFRMQDLGEAALKELGDLREAFKATILAVDKRIAADLTKLKELTTEANEVLQHYGKIVTDRLSAAVQAEWNKYLARQKALSDFKVRNVTKVVLGTVGVAVAVASVVLSFGTAWMNIAAACKGLLDLAKTVKTLTEGIDDVYAKLLDDIKDINAILEKRKKGGSQTASKAKGMAKAVAASALPFAKDLIKSTKTVEQNLQQFAGLISKLEKEENALSGKIETISKNLTGMPDRFLDTVQLNLNRRAQKQIEVLFRQIQELHNRVKNAIKTHAAWSKQVDILKKTDAWAVTADARTSNATIGIALYAAVNFIVECAEHGASIAKLVGI